MKKIENITKNNRKKFKKIAIRSSNFSEDTKETSAAGKFLSILNIKANNREDIEYNINEVIHSYREYKNNKNKIMIQEMVQTFCIQVWRCHA